MAGGTGDRWLTRTRLSLPIVGCLFGGRTRGESGEDQDGAGSGHTRCNKECAVGPESEANSGDVGKDGTKRPADNAGHR